jgi:hypothetical protein
VKKSVSTACAAAQRNASIIVYEKSGDLEATVTVNTGVLLMLRLTWNNGTQSWALSPRLLCQCVRLKPRLWTTPMPLLEQLCLNVWLLPLGLQRSLR